MPKKETNSLLEALQFVSIVQNRRSKLPQETHCRFFGNRLAAVGGPLSVGTVIQEEIECVPDTLKLLEALKKCPEAVNLTMLTTKELSVKSGNFHAVIPCIEQGLIPAIYPDPRNAFITADFLTALFAVGSILTDKAKTIMQSSARLLDGSIIGSNGEVILEAWHGCAVPPGAIVPALFIQAVKKSKAKALCGLGVTVESLTAHYDDGSWIRTKLHNDPAFPNLGAFLTTPCNPMPTPLGFFEAIQRLKPFSKNGRVYITAEGLCTDTYTTDGAINLCSGLPIGISFNIEGLLDIAQFAEQIAFAVDDKMSYFFGPKVRGAIHTLRLG